MLFIIYSCVRNFAGPGEIDSDAVRSKDAISKGIKSLADLGGVALGVTSAALLATSIPQGK
jgi:hypothetical protein